jgi:hypothetical protein
MGGIENVHQETTGKRHIGQRHHNRRTVDKRLDSARENRAV